MKKAGETPECCMQFGCLGSLLWELCSATLLCPGKRKKKTSQEVPLGPLLVLHEVTCSADDIFVVVMTLGSKTVLKGWCTRSATVSELQHLVGSKMRPEPVGPHEIKLVLGSSTLASQEQLGALLGNNSAELSITMIRSSSFHYLTLDRSSMNMDVFCLQSREACCNLRGHRNGILQVFAGFEEARILTKSSDGTVRWWDISRGICLASRHINAWCDDMRTVSLSVDVARECAFIAYSEAQQASCMKLWDCASDRWLLRLPTCTEQHTLMAWDFDIFAMSVLWDKMQALLCTGIRPSILNQPVHPSVLHLVDVMTGTFLQKIMLEDDVVDLPSVDWFAWRALCVTGSSLCVRRGSLYLQCLQTGTRRMLCDLEFNWQLGVSCKVDVNWTSNRAVFCTDLQQESDFKMLDLETSAVIFSTRYAPIHHIVVDWGTQYILFCQQDSMSIVELEKFKVVRRVRDRELLPFGYKGTLNVAAVAGNIIALLMSNTSLK